MREFERCVHLKRVVCTRRDRIAHAVLRASEKEKVQRASSPRMQFARMCSKSTRTSIWWYNSQGEWNFYSGYNIWWLRVRTSARWLFGALLRLELFVIIILTSPLANSSSHSEAFNSRRSFGTWIICYTRRERNYVAFINHGVQSRATRLRRIFYNLFSYVPRAVIYSIGRPSTNQRRRILRIIARAGYARERKREKESHSS